VHPKEVLKFHSPRSTIVPQHPEFIGETARSIHAASQPQLDPAPKLPTACHRKLISVENPNGENDGVFRPFRLATRRREKKT